METTVASTRRPRAAEVSDKDFVAACLKAKSIDEIAEATGLAKTTVQQRRVRLHNAGVALPALQRGGGRKAGSKDLSELNKLIAEQLGKPVEEVEKEAQELKQAHAERVAERAAEKEAEGKEPEQA